MSIEAISWAFEQPDISSTEKFVLVVLGDFANQDHESFPAQKTISRMTNLSERAIRGALLKLEQRGLILRTPRRLRGVPTSDWYKLAAPMSERPQPRGNVRPVSFGTMKMVYERDGYKCKKCGSGSNLSIDHIQPRLLNGSNEPDNLQVLCRSCNSSKGASTLRHNNKGNPLPAPDAGSLDLPAPDAATQRNDVPQVPAPDAADPLSDPSVDPITTSFDFFYATYPRHEARADAFKAWKILKPDDATICQIQTDLRRFAGRERQFIPLPATYLRGRRWEDERTVTVAAPIPEPIVRARSENAEAMAETLTPEQRAANRQKLSDIAAGLKCA